MGFLRAAGLLSQVDPSQVGGWATYGPLGLIVAVLIVTCWYFIRREAARADRWEAIALKLIEANRISAQSQNSAHAALQVRDVSADVLDALILRALGEDKKK